MHDQIDRFIGPIGRNQERKQLGLVKIIRQGHSYCIVWLIYANFILYPFTSGSLLYICIIIIIPYGTYYSNLFYIILF